MARGWESKSVESQMEEAAESRRIQSAKAEKSREQLAFQRELESLQLSRTRVLRDLGEATHARYRETLELALRHLDAKIAIVSTEQSDT
jgi:hypothetical protein